MSRHIEGSRREIELDLEVGVLRQMIGALMIVQKKKAMIAIEACRHARSRSICLACGQTFRKNTVIIGARLAPKSFKKRWSVFRALKDGFICSEFPNRGLKVVVLHREIVAITCSLDSCKVVFLPSGFVPP